MRRCTGRGRGSRGHGGEGVGETLTPAGRWWWRGGRSGQVVVLFLWNDDGGGAAAAAALCISPAGQELQ